MVVDTVVETMVDTVVDTVVVRSLWVDLWSRLLYVIKPTSKEFIQLSSLPYVGQTISSLLIRAFHHIYVVLHILIYTLKVPLSTSFKSTMNCIQ